jgi:hypothetical protein
MGTYLYTLDNEPVSDQSSTLSRLVITLMTPWRQEAEQKRQQRSQAKHQKMVDAAVAKGEFLGFAANYEDDFLRGREYILAEAFEAADEQLPWSVHLLPHIGMQVTRLKPELYQSLLEYFDRARDIIHSMAVQKQIVLIS